MSKYMMIDGMKVRFSDEKNILTVIRNAGIDLPTFCYYSDLSTFGACRMCVVEDQWGGIIASCSTPPKDKMEVKTSTPKLYHYRRTILELLLASHCRDCTVCDKNGKCSLQDLAYRFGIRDIRFPNSACQDPIDNSSYSIVRDPSKCILCGDCVRVCNEIQNVGAIDFAHRGSNMIVSTAFGKNIVDTNCVNCGQCAAVCPTGAITIKKNTREVWEEIFDPKKRVVVQIAPAVRVALGEEFGYAPGKNLIGKITAALRKIGFDAVYDTSFTADLTIMEEAAELIKKIESGNNEFPLFTSCCPGWVKYVENQHPELMEYVSTCKSPMQMMGAVLRDYYGSIDKEDGKTTVSVAIMPCTAKKAEAAREEFMTEGRPDVDYVITTQELADMIKEAGIVFNELHPEGEDMPYSLYSGAGVIFGATGGVMEAAIRRVVEDKSHQSLKEIEYSGVRGMKGIKESEVPFGNSVLRVAVVSGLQNAETLIKKLQNGEVKYDFVEVMACPGGCIAGAGQPFSHLKDKKKRTEGIYDVDGSEQIKCSDCNPAVIDLYDNVIKDRAHEMLHVHYQK
ncbi:2Fe-2S iron-sulfur cluster binding domain-containing protein [Anaerosacchariphilus polymeriproducens]|uniref:4Fe-4S dicluster domain-containing protein n=1 Tax=Anaerosacchariphilus polymeriproducens TaxID=1812858 RepID=A0A371ARQ3_9FIRM|nr:2Fe-2S iron-sulfur cluster binding domain-containing protein [Anaerosacchariphilus polymeriproducens]RDU22160.1 4Fe-4S dicluster domain-containing protein [Anaerosacchariphilus polymeriproducens]